MPRKKAVSSTDAAGVPIPVSSRSTRAATRQVNAAPASTAKPVSKPKSSKKRVRDDDDEADVAPSKIAKLNKDDDTSDNKADNDSEVKKMVSTGCPVSHTARCLPLNFQVTVVKRGAAPVDPTSGLICKCCNHALRAWK